MPFIVAIDGPAGSGKGTVTKQLAKQCRLVNIDTRSYLSLRSASRIAKRT